MKKIATLLMKELNYLKKEAAKLQQEDVDLSNVPLDENMRAIYDTGYVYENNRARSDMLPPLKEVGDFLLKYVKERTNA